MQCKDIPDAPVLAFLVRVQNGELLWTPAPGQRGWAPSPYASATWFWTDTFKPANSVLNAMPSGTPEKLGLAKMRQMIRRGVVDGCPCGCRGDFTITDKGRAELARETQPS